MPAEIFYIQSRRAKRMRGVQTVQHVFAAVVLVMAALDHLTGPHGHFGLLPILEIAAGATLIGSVAVEKVRHRLGKGGHGKVAWVELAGAAMVLVEAIAKLQQRHHLLFYVLSFIQPVVLFLFAVFDLQIARRRYLKADDHGFEIRVRLLFARRAAWATLREYRIEPKAIVLTNAEDRTRRFSIRDIRNRDEAVAWTREQFAKRGLVETLPAQELPGGERGAEDGQRDQRLVAQDD